MAYDEFLTDSDKPYAENLNDSLLLLDAFDVTVPLEMPGMFSNGDFSSSVNTPRKCGVGIVTLKSVDSGVTVGTDSISGTGEVVFRVYPNFNSFYKWQSIVLENTGSVEIGFKKTDGSEISATVGSDGTISEASALKELQEIDVVFTLSSASISNILISFVNNQSNHTRVNAQLEADQLVNVDGTVASGDTKAVSGDTVNTALNSGLSLKEDLSNKVSTLNTSTTNYPSCKAVKDKLDLKSDTGHTHIISNVTNLQSTLNDKLDTDDLLDLVYPVGAIYIDANSSNSTCPIQTLLGGIWERIQDRFLLAAPGNQGVGITGGEASHTLTVDEIPSHNHRANLGIRNLNNSATASTSNHVTNWSDKWNEYVSNMSANTGGGQAHNNMPPYLVVNVWRRIE